MKFSHTADCHLGGHRNAKLQQLQEEAFQQFVQQSIADNVDFCLIAGDLFNTALPGIDTLKFAVQQLGRLKQEHIPVYVIPGSHDFSPSGKSMLDVLEEARLIINVCKIQEEGSTISLMPVKDAKTGVHITGILGKRGMLDAELYQKLSRDFPEGEKLFLFHTAIEGCTPAGMPGMPIATLPKGFRYYAGGHIHIVRQLEHDGSPVVYPGPLFPNSFSELEELQQGGYWLYDNGTIVRRDIALKNVLPFTVDIDGCTSAEANAKLQQLTEQNVQDAIVLLRVEGTLSEGSIADLALRSVSSKLQQSAYTVLRNTAKIQMREFEAQDVTAEDAPDIEEYVLKEHAKQLELPERDGVALARQLMQVLGQERNDGERQYEYEERAVKAAMKIVQERP